jgi:hypothetical protein
VDFISVILFMYDNRCSTFICLTNIAFPVKIFCFSLFTAYSWRFCVALMLLFEL